MAFLYLAEKDTGAVGVEGMELDRYADDENQRSDLKAFLDQCQAEFTYLMITPANPMPPRESPPLPLLDELREGDFGLPTGQQQIDQYAQAIRPTQNHVRETSSRPAPAPTNHVASQSQPGPSSNYAVKPSALQPTPMVRTNAETGPMYGNATAEWPPATTVTSRLVDEGMGDPNHAMKGFGGQDNGEDAGEKRGMTEADGWDFNDAPFPESNAANPAQPVPSRPDTDLFPVTESLPKSPNRGPNAHRRKSSISRRRSAEHELSLDALAQKTESGNFKLRFGLRGHLDTVRTVIFSGGGSPGEPEICTAGDDGLIKRFHIPRNPGHLGASAASSDLDVQADFTHRGHNGAVLCLASWSPSPNFSTGGRAQGDGWIFSGGQDAFVRVWERGRVDPKATLDGHTDAVWSLCVLPATLGSVFGQNNPYGSPDRILLASGAADGTVRLWAVSAPPQLTSPQPSGAAGRRAPGSSGRVRGNSMSSGVRLSQQPAADGGQQ